MTASRTALVFDLGGVLIRWDPRHLYRKLFPGDPEGMERFLAEVCTPAWNMEQCRGRPFSAGVDLLCRRFPDQRALITAYHERWEEMLDGAIEENVALLAEIVTTGRPVYALTDWSAETFPIARRRFGFLAAFTGIVVSGAEGHLKPSAELFGILCRRYGLHPATTTFIDDSRENYHGARRLGFDAIHYRDPARLRAALADRGWVAGAACAGAQLHTGGRSNTGSGGALDALHQAGSEP